MADELSKIRKHFPQAANRLESLCSSGAVNSQLHAAAISVWALTQTWLTFLDGQRKQLVFDDGIYDSIVELAGQSPRCSIEDEAEAWMVHWAVAMSDAEIRLALECAVERIVEVGRSLGVPMTPGSDPHREVASNAEEAFRTLVQARNRHISLRADLTELSE